MPKNLMQKLTPWCESSLLFRAFLIKSLGYKNIFFSSFLSEFYSQNLAAIENKSDNFFLKTISESFTHFLVTLRNIISQDFLKKKMLRAY